MGQKRYKKKSYRAAQKRESQCVLGGVRYHDKKRMCFFVQQGNSISFYEQLEKLDEFVKKEWVEQGNQIEHYPKSGPKILIILDNASYHKKREILEKIEINLPNIQLYFLRPYSPDFNLAELVWHSAKEYIAHHLFKSVDELKIC